MINALNSFRRVMSVAQWGAPEWASAAMGDVANRFCFQASRNTLTINGLIGYNTPKPPTQTPVDIGDIPTSCAVKNRWDTNFRSVTQNRELLEDPFNGWLEKFVKVEINNPIQVGTTVPVLTKHGLETYQVHRKMAKQGLVAYALTPTRKDSHLSPLVAFRCTETNPFKEQAFNSVHNDVTSRIGEKGWMANREDFQELMQDPLFRGENEKVQVVGYSLGGAYAQRFIAEHFKEVSRGTTYNAPSIDAETAEDFAAKANEISAQNPLVIQIFRSVGDPFHHFGEKHLGWGVDHPSVKVQLLEVEYPNQTKFDFDLHRLRIFDTNNFNYTIHEYHDPKELKNLLNNYKRDPFSSSAESVRHHFSGFLSSVISAFGSFFHWISNLFGDG